MSHKSTMPAVHVDANIPTSEIDVDSEGNVIIRNKELAQKMKAFLASQPGKALARPEYHLLCCKLTPPTL